MGVTEEFADHISGSPPNARIGDYTLEEARRRIGDFKRNANRQLALMTLQRSKRAVEVKRLRWRAGAYEVPGEGLPIWSFDDVENHAVEQVRLIEDWTGERIASEDVDDSRIANECALRPKPKLSSESLVRQCEYSKAAAILVKTMELVRLRGGGEVAPSSTALWLVPSLLEEYLKLCGLAEFAPIAVGGTRRPYTKVMALFQEIYSLYLQNSTVAGALATTMLSGPGILARRRAAGAIADRSFDARQFMTLPAGEPVDGDLEVALVSSGRTVGDWPGCLSYLKQTAPM